MTEKEMKKLSRTELLALLVDSYKEIEQLKSRAEEAEQKLQSRQITIENAGSLADAAVELNHVLLAAQAAADQYLENITAMAKKTEEDCQRREAESVEKSERMLAEATRRCEAMEAEAKRKSEEYCEEVVRKVQAVIGTHAELKVALDQPEIHITQETL